MDEEWEAMKMEAELEQKEENIKYKELQCRVCGEETSHVEVDTVEGKKMQCEICGTYEGEGNE